MKKKTNINMTVEIIDGRVRVIEVEGKPVSKKTGEAIWELFQRDPVFKESSKHALVQILGGKI